MGGVLRFANLSPLARRLLAMAQTMSTYNGIPCMSDAAEVAFANNVVQYRSSTSVTDGPRPTNYSSHPIDRRRSISAPTF